MRSETGWPAVGRWFWAAAAAAVALALVCGLSSARWLNRPFPGFFLWENRFVPAVGDTDWTGHRAGVPYQSRLMAIDGQPVATADEAYAAAESRPVGSVLHYEFQPARGAPVGVAVPTMRLSLPEYLWTLGNYLAVGLVLTLLGFVVYFLRPDAPAARAMWAAGATWGLYLITAADIFGPAWFRPLCLLLQALGPVTLVHLALTFPVERAVLQRRPWLLPALYVAALAVGVVDNISFHRSFAVLLAIDRVNSTALIGAGMLLLGSLGESFMRPPSAAARQRIKIAALGAAAAFVVPVAGFLAYYLGGVSFPLNFVTLSMVLFPLAIGYAIVQHDLFEVDAIIRRTVSWAILTALLAALYLSGVGVLDVAFTGRSGRIAQLLFVIAVVALMNPLRDRVQRAVDALFARQRYDYRGTVTRISQSLATLLDADAIVAQILTTVTATMRVDFGAVWLRDDDGTYHRAAQGGARPDPPPVARLAADHAIARRLAAAPQTILTDEPARRDAERDAAVAGLGGTLIVPIAFEQRPLGFIVLGDKESGQFYSGEDRGLLETLASQSAVALQNARSYRELVRTNDTLRSTQAQLIQAERFAAIGEVSAAVAHGIRNPVAGIKTAAHVAGLEVGREHAAHSIIGDIIAESNKLEARIKALLNFARPFEPQRAPAGPAALVDEAAAALRSQIAAARVELSVAVDPQLPTVLLDRAQMVEVLLILMSNAVDAMPDGGRLAVAARCDVAQLTIDVRDSGPGMSPEQQSRLFRLFSTTKPTGNGIGLAVAKKIVDRHGGQITVQSAVGTGTCFTIHLPR
ncbi:MAG: sensor histidine kinase [Candidatus Binatia bacterium]